MARVASLLDLVRGFCFHLIEKSVSTSIENVPLDSMMSSDSKRPRSREKEYPKSEMGDGYSQSTRISLLLYAKTL